MATHVAKCSTISFIITLCHCWKSLMRSLLCGCLLPTSESLRYVPEFYGHQSKFVIFCWNIIAGIVYEVKKQKFNQAEGTLWILKGRWKIMIMQKRAPLRLWYFVMKHDSESMNRMWNPQTCHSWRRTYWTLIRYFGVPWFWILRLYLVLECKQSARVGRSLGVATKRVENFFGSTLTHLTWQSPTLKLPITPTCWMRSHYRNANIEY